MHDSIIYLWTKVLYNYYTLKQFYHHTILYCAVWYISLYYTITPSWHDVTFYNTWPLPHHCTIVSYLTILSFISRSGLLVRRDQSRDIWYIRRQLSGRSFSSGVFWKISRHRDTRVLTTTIQISSVRTNIFEHDPACFCLRTWNYIAFGLLHFLAFCETVMCVLR